MSKRKSILGKISASKVAGSKCLYCSSTCSSNCKCGEAPKKK